MMISEDVLIVVLMVLITELQMGSIGVKIGVR